MILIVVGIEIVRRAIVVRVRTQQHHAVRALDPVRQAVDHAIAQRLALRRLHAHEDERRARLVHRWCKCRHGHRARGGSLNATSKLNLGRLQTGSNYFTGALDEVTIYGTVLSAGPVSTHFQRR